MSIQLSPPPPKICCICEIGASCRCCRYCKGRALSTCENWKDGMCGCKPFQCLDVVEGELRPWLSALRSFLVYFDPEKNPCQLCLDFVSNHK